MKAPDLISPSTESEISKSIKGKLKRSSLHWDPDKDTAGGALVDLFSRLAEVVIERLNQTPDKHMLAFLNMAGVDLLAPQAATTDLTFSLDKEGPVSVRVPAGTQAATTRKEGQPEIVFETSEDLVVVRNEMIACLAVDPVKSSDRTAIARRAKAGAFDAFAGETERQRYLYLGDNVLFTFDDDASRTAATVTLNFQFEKPGDAEKDGWRLEWRYWDGKEWAVFPSKCIEDKTNIFSSNGSIVFRRLPEMKPTAVDGQTSTWLQCGLIGGESRTNLPVLKTVTGQQEIKFEADGENGASLPVDRLFNAAVGGAVFVELNPGEEFFPLGQNPGRMDAFYVQSDQAFSKQDTTVTLAFKLNGVSGEPERPAELDRLRLVWEYSTSTGWQELATSDRHGNTFPRKLDFTDGTQALAKNGEVTVAFTLPSAGAVDHFAKTKVNAIEGYWLRARLLSGSYNEPGWVQEKVKDDKKWMEWVEPHNHAPLVANFRIRCSRFASSLAERRLAYCYSRIDGQGISHFPLPLAIARQSQVVETSEDSAVVTLDASASTGSFGHKVTKFRWSGNADSSGEMAVPTFTPFSSNTDEPALYLGFQNAFPAQQWIRLLLNVEESDEWTPLLKDFADLRAMQQDPVEPLAWEYWNGERWQGFQVADETRNLRRRGYVGFFAPADHRGAEWFGVKAFWLRVRPELEVLPGSGPRLKTLDLNTVPARNSITLRNEVLGSSNGKADQIFRLSRRPVLPDIHLEVREPDRPASEEMKTLKQEIDRQEKDGVDLATPAGDAGQGYWVRWRCVPDFHGLGANSDDVSGATSRHFVLNAATGEIHFGDGAHGRIPLAGANNIRVVSYRTHDAAAGNVEAGQVVVLRNPGGDLKAIKRVENREAAAGGAAAETVDHVRIRGPQTLRHRHRAVAAEDFRWLAEGAGSELAHAWCLPTRDEEGRRRAGYVTVFVVPISNERKPMPRPALLQLVRDRLRENAPATLATLGDDKQITVRAPQYVEVSVTATIAATDPAQADAVALNVVQRLEAFLHPTRGGPEGQGWAFFDRPIFCSEIYALIEAVDGVDYVMGVSLQAPIMQWKLLLETPGHIPFQLRAGSQVSTFDQRIKLGLARGIEANEYVESLPVYGFGAGDVIRIAGQTDQERFIIKKIENTEQGSPELVLVFDKPFDPKEVKAVLSTDGRLRLPIIPGNGLETTRVKVRGFGPGGSLSLVTDENRLDFLRIDKIEAISDRVFIPEGYLVCSGKHEIAKALGKP